MVTAAKLPETESSRINQARALFVREDFIGEDGVFIPSSWEKYQIAIKSYSLEELMGVEQRLLAGDGEGGQFVNKSARNRVKVRDLWGSNNLKYCAGDAPEDKKSNPNSVIGSARDQVEAQVDDDAFSLAVAAIKEATGELGKSQDVSRIDKNQCNRMSAYQRIEADRLRAEARAMAADARSFGQNAVVLDIYAKMTVGGIIALGVGTVLSLGAVAVAKLGAASASGSLAKLGWLGKIIKTGLPYALPVLWGYGVQAFYFVYNFDWNITDAAIDRGSTAGISNIAGSLGSLVGNTAGWLACGLAPATAIAAIDPVRGLLAKKEVTEEMIDELSDELWVLVNQATRQIARAAFLQSYKHIRRWVKDVNSPQYKIFTTAFGKDAIDKWGKGTPFTIAGQVNKAIEDLGENPVIVRLLGEQGAMALEEFAEETVEGFLDSCVEAGFVVTSAYSQALLQQERQKVAILGEVRTVEIEINRKSS